MARECESCRFYYSDQHSSECRRYAPRCLIVTATIEHDPLAMWPAVEPDDWCGEYEEHRNGSSEILAGVAAAAERRARERRG